MFAFLDFSRLFFGSCVSRGVFCFWDFILNFKLSFKYVVFSVAMTSACPTFPLLYKTKQSKLHWMCPENCTLMACRTVSLTPKMVGATSCHSSAEDLVKQVEPQLILAGWNRTASVLDCQQGTGALCRRRRSDWNPVPGSRQDCPTAPSIPSIGKGTGWPHVRHTS